MDPVLLCEMEFSHHHHHGQGHHATSWAASVPQTIQAPPLVPPPQYSLVMPGIHRCSAVGLEEVLNGEWHTLETEDLRLQAEATVMGIPRSELATTAARVAASSSSANRQDVGLTAAHSRDGSSRSVGRRGGSHPSASGCQNAEREKSQGVAIGSSRSSNSSSNSGLKARTVVASGSQISSRQSGQASASASISSVTQSNPTQQSASPSRRYAEDTGNALAKSPTFANPMNDLQSTRRSVPGSSASVPPAEGLLRPSPIQESWALGPYEAAPVLSFMSTSQIRTIVYLSPSLLPCALLKLAHQLNLNLVQWNLVGPKVWRMRSSESDSAAQGRGAKALTEEAKALRRFAMSRQKKRGRQREEGLRDPAWPTASASFQAESSGSACGDLSQEHEQAGKEHDHGDCGDEDNDDDYASSEEGSNVNFSQGYFEDEEEGQIQGLDHVAMCRATIELALNKHCNGVLICDS